MTDTALQPTLDTEYLPVDKLIPNPDNVRTDLGDLTGLADSIAQLGVLEPLIVYPVEGGWTLIAGHRRLASAKLAGVDEVPCVIRQAVDKLTLLEMMLAENGHRSDLDPIDEGLALVELRKANRYRTFAKLAEAVNHSPDWVRDRIVLVEKLPEKSWAAIRSREVPLEDAVTVARAPLDAKAKAKVLEAPAEQRKAEIGMQRRKAEKAAKLKALRDEHGTIFEWPPRVGRDHPWGCVQLGDKPGMLNVPTGLHTGCPGHAVVWQEWAKSLTGYCLEPHLHHLDPADYVDAEDQVVEDLGSIDPAKMVPVTSIDGVGENWQARDRHQEHCKGHRTLSLPWGRIDVCTDPTIHTNPKRKGYLPGHQLANMKPGDRHAGPPRWTVHDDARQLLTQRLRETIGDLPDWAAASLTSAFAAGSLGEDETPLDLLVRTGVDDIVAQVEHAAGSTTWLAAEDVPLVPGINAVLQACVDVGAPPPNLDEIRTRIDVITKGEGSDDA